MAKIIGEWTPKPKWWQFRVKRLLKKLEEGE